MEGAFTAYEGSWVNFGWHFTVSGASSYSIVWINPTASFIYACTQGGTPQYYTVSYPTTTYTPANLPPQDEHEAWQNGFAVQLPALCGAGQPIYSTTKGAAFGSAVCSTSALKISTQWHYRVPGSKGGTIGNVNLAAWCPVNTNNGKYGSTCGASWSATVSTSIPACSFCSGETLPSSNLNSGERNHVSKWMWMWLALLLLLL
jgi:hypothetical protein